VRLQQLDHRQSDQAHDIWRLLHDAYSVEASIIGADDFPPLRRTVADIASAQAQFIGAGDEARLLAVCEFSIDSGNSCEITSFGVDPSSFRQGYGSMLLRNLISMPGILELSVATAAANTPAIRFYEKHGFACSGEWLTPEKIAVVRMVRAAVA